MGNEEDVSAAWPRVGEKLPPQFFGPFSREHLHEYAAASGDDNPLHLDEDLARRVGLESPPVHGMLVMSCFEPTLRAWRADLRLARLSGKFVQPLLRGERVEISGRVVQSRASATREAVLRLMAHSERRALVILAEATLVPAGDRIP